MRLFGAEKAWTKMEEKMKKIISLLLLVVLGVGIAMYSRHQRKEKNFQEIIKRQEWSLHLGYYFPAYMKNGKEIGMIYSGLVGDSLVFECVGDEYQHQVFIPTSAKEFVLMYRAFIILEYSPQFVVFIARETEGIGSENF